MIEEIKSETGGATAVTYAVPLLPKYIAPKKAIQMARQVIMPSEFLNSISMASNKNITKNCKITTPGFVKPGPLIGELIVNCSFTYPPQSLPPQ